MAAAAVSEDPIRLRSTSFEDDGVDEDEGWIQELQRMNSTELEIKAQEFQKNVGGRQDTTAGGKKPAGRTTLVNEIVDDGPKGADDHRGKKGAFAGVFVPTCENMWGVLIFLRFFYVVGHAGVIMALVAVVLSFSCAFCTTSSMSATVSSGGFVSKGGPYYMISRALGPCVGASVGVMYWLAMTMLAVLETLGAVEGILMMAPELDDIVLFRQICGSALMISLVTMVWAGINFVTKMGIFFVFIVFFTLFIYYVGLFETPLTTEAEINPWVTGLSSDTLNNNLWPHYGDGVRFGTVLSVFFPCFTGILSGANRADVLKDPPKALRQGTFGAIIFSLFMYSSFMILWGMVADYRYLQGEIYVDPESRRLAGGETAAHVVTDIVWNPFPNAAILGIIISSLSQALQCLIVAPRLLQKLAEDKIITALNRIGTLSAAGEPVRALIVTYVVGAGLVLMGQLNLVAPLLSMCFLVAYAFMNLSCFALTLLGSSDWRPKGIHQRRWRWWYLATSGCGSVICITIMFTIDPFWALAAIAMSSALYCYLNYRIEQKGWGSAMDGIRFKFALNSLLQLEGSQSEKVNWRPQVLILYRIRLDHELKGIKHHEILRFYSQLRKGRGFCMVACVMEADRCDEHALHKAKSERTVIQTIMKEEKIEGFSEVVVAPTWVEGSNYAIQLTGLGGMAPNTVLLDWPENWRKQKRRARDFAEILSSSLASDKAVLAVKGLQAMPNSAVEGTIDIWWMIHDGGLLILLTWLMTQHKVWRKCHLRIFTVAEGVTEKQAISAGKLLTKTLRQKRLFDVQVEVILADDEMLEPYSFDWNRRVEDRHRFLQKAHPSEAVSEMHRHETIPLEIEDLFKMEAEEAQRLSETVGSKASHEPEEMVSVSDFRDSHALHSEVPKPFSKLNSKKGNEASGASSSNSAAPRKSEEIDGSVVNGSKPVAEGDVVLEGLTSVEEESLPAEMQPEDASGTEAIAKNMTPARRVSVANAMVRSREDPLSSWEEPNVPNVSPRGSSDDGDRARAAEAKRLRQEQLESFHKLNQIIYSRSKKSQLVVMNLPDQWGVSDVEVENFMTYCDMLTKGLERVLFVHSTGHEVFEFSS